VFARAKEDAEEEFGLQSFYFEGRTEDQVQVLAKKYAYYLAGQIGGQFTAVKNLSECHSAVSKARKS
jgi:hypothetical protein